MSSRETDSDSEILPSPHPRRRSLKRGVSTPFLHPCSYIKKRRKRPRSVPEIPIGCRYPILLPGDYTMSQSCSNIDSNRSILPTPLPSPAVDDTEHARRPLQVAELINRLNFRLKRLFGSRKGSLEDENPSRVSSDTRRSSMSFNLRGPAEPPNVDCDPAYLRWNGSSQLPNVSEFFDTNGEVGPSSFYNTADWNAFQETLQAQGNAATQTHANSHGWSNGDPGLDRFDLFRANGIPSSDYETRARKDSLFSFTDFLRSRRSSKVDKGKGRVIVENEVAMTPHEEAALLPTSKTSSGVQITSLAAIGILPRVSTETTSALSPKESQDVPQAEYSSLESSILSLHHSASSTPPDDEAQETHATSVSQVDSYMAIPPSFCSEAHAVDPKDACASPASSVSNIDDSVAITRSGAGSATTDDNKAPSVPLANPSCAKASSSPSLFRHANQPSATTPSTPSLLPTVVPSSLPLTPMQTLSLGPPRHSLRLRRCFSSDGRGTTTRASSGATGLRKSLDEKCWWDNGE